MLEFFNNHHRPTAQQAYSLLTMIAVLTANICTSSPKLCKAENLKLKVSMPRPKHPKKKFFDVQRRTAA